MVDGGTMGDGRVDYGGTLLVGGIKERCGRASRPKAGPREAKPGRNKTPFCPAGQRFVRYAGPSLGRICLMV